MYIAEYIVAYGTHENPSEFGVQSFDCDFKDLSELEMYSFQMLKWNHCPAEEEINALKNRLHVFFETFCLQKRRYECLEMMNTFGFKSRKYDRQFSISVLLRPFKRSDCGDFAYFRRKWKQEIMRQMKKKNR